MTQDTKTSPSREASKTIASVAGEMRPRAKRLPRTSADVSWPRNFFEGLKHADPFFTRSAPPSLISSRCNCSMASTHSRTAVRTRIAAVLIWAQAPGQKADSR